MRHFWKLLLILTPALFCSAVAAQRIDDVLATSTNATFTAATLSPQGQKLYLEQRKMLADTRTELLSEMIANAVLELEARATNSTKEKLLATQRTKAAQPTAAEIQKIYNANS